MNSIVACCHSAKLCAYAARDFRSQQFTIIITIGCCQIFILKNPDLIGFFKIEPRHPDGLKKSKIWVEKKQQWEPWFLLSAALHFTLISEPTLFCNDVHCAPWQRCSFNTLTALLNDVLQRKAAKMLSPLFTTLSTSHHRCHQSQGALMRVPYG